MGARSAVLQLPDDVRQALDRELVARQFSGYSDLEAWLTAQGFSVSRSSIHRYGTRFERRLSAMQLATTQAKALIEASPDEEGAMNEALVRMVQHQLFDVLADIADAEDSGDAADRLPKIAQAVSRLTESSVRQKRYAQDVKARAQLAAETITATARKAGLSADLVDQIRADILGIAA